MYNQTFLTCPMYLSRLLLSLCTALFLAFQYATAQQLKTQDTTRFDRDYVLEASMVGYFSPDGARNPTLRANKGDRVRIKITNAELMTHDIALEKMGIKSKTILEKGMSTTLTFTATQSDIYYCSVPATERQVWLEILKWWRALFLPRPFRGSCQKRRSTVKS